MPLQLYTAGLSGGESGTPPWIVWDCQTERGGRGGSSSEKKRQVPVRADGCRRCTASLNPFHKQNIYISRNMIFIFLHIPPVMNSNIYQCIYQCHPIIPDHKIWMSYTAVGMSWMMVMPARCWCLTSVLGSCHIPSQTKFLCPHSPCRLPPFPPRSHSPSPFLMFP